MISLFAHCSLELDKTEDLETQLFPAPEIKPNFTGMMKIAKIRWSWEANAS